MAKRESAKDKRKRLERDFLMVARGVRRWVIKEHGISDGQCSSASDKIKDRLEDLGIECEVVDGDFFTGKVNGVSQASLNRRVADLKRRNDYHNIESHWWLESSGMIIDVTVDQFNLDLPGDDQAPKVLVAPKRALRRYFAH